MGYSIGNGRPWPAPQDLKPLSWQNLVPSANLISHHSGNGTLNDSSANARHLAKGAGSQYVTYSQGVGGQLAIHLGGQSWLDLANASHNAAYQLTGDYTLVCILCLQTLGACFLASCDSTADAVPDDNMTWGIGIGATSGWAVAGGLYPIWEYGDRVDYSYSAQGNIHVPRYDPCMIAMRRTISGSNATSQYQVNGVNVLDTPRTDSSKNPSGGANGILRIGADTYGVGNKITGWIQSLIIANTGIDDATLQAEAARCGFYQPAA